MKHNIPYFLSMQREIKSNIINFESCIDKLFGELHIRTLLNRSNILKLRGYSACSLLYILVLSPFVKRSLTSLFNIEFYIRTFKAKKDTYYRFLNSYRYNWRKFLLLLSYRIINRLEEGSYEDKVLIADDSFIRKSGRRMELVSYHFDSKRKSSCLGYQLLQLGYHDGRRFFPLDFSVHTSSRRANDYIRCIDKRTLGWRLRQEAFKKKTEVLIEMVQRVWNMGISARFILFDSWFSCPKVISAMVDIGYDVICGLKRSKVKYFYNGKYLTLSQLWSKFSRHNTRWISSLQTKCMYLDVVMPEVGKVRIVFVKCSRKQWKAFLCTDTSLSIEDILKYYARRWTIEIFFKDCKQLLDLGKGQTIYFDAFISLTSIVMLRYLLLAYILAKRNSNTPIGPLFEDISQEHINLMLFEHFWSQIKNIFALSSLILFDEFIAEKINQVIEFIENYIIQYNIKTSAKL